MRKRRGLLDNQDQIVFNVDFLELGVSQGLPVRKGIQRIFSDVVKTYELVNHVLTLGLDIVWRRKAARLASKKGGSRWLDVCSGTGEMALNLSRQADKRVKIVSVDFCTPMLERGKEKRN
ncbi:MAG: class I SAM-dependent methyltransferase, partial [Candidatus Aminicenantes bacterium]